MNLSLKTLTNWYIWFFTFLSYHPSSLTKCQPCWDLSDGLPSPLLHPRLLNSAREHYTIIPIWDVIHSLFPTSVHPLIVLRNYSLSTRTFSSILWWLLQSSLFVQVSKSSTLLLIHLLLPKENRRYDNRNTSNSCYPTYEHPWLP